MSVLSCGLKSYFVLLALLPYCVILLLSEIFVVCVCGGGGGGGEGCVCELNLEFDLV